MSPARVERAGCTSKKKKKKEDIKEKKHPRAWELGRREKITSSCRSGSSDLLYRSDGIS
jgi:hypothetical protein